MSSIGDSMQKFRDKLSTLGKRSGGGDSGSGSKGAKFDPKKALGWMRRNPAIVASVLVIILAPVAAWWFSSEMNAAADDATKKRAEEMVALERLEKTPVEISLPKQAPLQQSGVVTPKMVAAFEDLNRRLHEDALAVQRAAVERNQRGRTALVTDIRVTAGNAATIVANVLGEIHKSVDKALADARAGLPPGDEGVLDQVKRRQEQFISSERKDSRKNLSPEELEKLTAALAEKRLQIYADAASRVSFYADSSTLGLPGMDLADVKPSESQMFYWQWRAWMVEDIIRALATANKPFRSVVEAPVKELVKITFLDAKSAEAIPVVKSAIAVTPTEGAPAEGEAAAAVPAGPRPIDPKLEVPYNFKASFTGRTTNPIYEVRKFRVELIVSTSALPDVMNAIAQENFMTITNMRVLPADPFAAAADGFILGNAPVSTVILDVESVWMREWLGKLMPKELQEARGTDGKTVDDMAASGGEPANG